MRYKLPKKGFTLLDILLVSAIVSLLSSLFLFNLSQARLGAEDARMQTEVQSVGTAIALYKEDHNGNPPLSSITGTSNAQRGVLHSEADSNSDYTPSMQLLVDGGYLPEIPKSSTGESYVYGVSVDGTQATFGARLNRPLSSSGSKKAQSCGFDPVTDWEKTKSEPSFYIGRPGSPTEGLCTNQDNTVRCPRFSTYEEYDAIFYTYCSDIDDTIEEACISKHPIVSKVSWSSFMSQMFPAGGFLIVHIKDQICNGDSDYCTCI
jgi:type II secretory pathway pseudopilin PulG